MNAEIRIQERHSANWVHALWSHLANTDTLTASAMTGESLALAMKATIAVIVIPTTWWLEEVLLRIIF